MKEIAMNNRKHNSAGTWEPSLSPLIADIQESIRKEIEAPTGRLGLGASVVADKIFMLDYTARNDPDTMVYTAFQETVNDATQKIAARPWPIKLTYYLRGPGKRTGFENDAFNAIQYVVAWLMDYYRPAKEPTYESVLSFINTFPGIPGAESNANGHGFNNIRLDWDRREDQKLQDKEKKDRDERDKQDAENAKKDGFEDDVEGWRNKKAIEAQERAKVNKEKALAEIIKAIIPVVVENCVAVDQPAKDGGNYFWSEPNSTWLRVPDDTWRRMILYGGRAGDAQLR